MKPINNNFDKLSSKEKLTNWFKNYTSNNGIHSKEFFEETTNIFYLDKDEEYIIFNYKTLKKSTITLKKSIQIKN